MKDRISEHHPYVDLIQALFAEGYDQEDEMFEDHEKFNKDYLAFLEDVFK